MRNLLLFSSIAFIVLCCSNEKSKLLDLTKYVDPQIGSVHCRWFFYTPASRPFGMAKLAPHTNAYNSIGGWGPTGYDNRHKSIEGFGHFHEFQIGGLVFMPTVGKIQTVPGSLENPQSGYRSSFDKETEKAEAGYYKVFLKDYKIKVELTSTERVGFHRYSFPKTKNANIIIDIGNKQGESSDVINAEAELINENEIEGYIETYPEYAKFCDPQKTVKMYFTAKFSHPVSSYGIFKDSLQQKNIRKTKGVKNGLFLTFSTEDNPIIEIKTGLSYTSIANAKLNLEKESKGKSFDLVRNNSKAKWNEKLNRIIVEGDEKDKIKFYTGLYHALLGRGISNDINGDYPKVDNGIGKIPLDENGKPKYNHYNTDGMWGGFWNLSILWGLAYPEHLSQYMQSNIDFYKDRGWLHDGEANGVFTNGVQTNFQGLLIASTYNMGIRDFEVDKGYEAALKNELEYKGRNLGNGKYNLHYFINNGYVPYKDTTISNGWIFNFGASHTLEYSFSSYAVSQMAKHMNDKKNYDKLIKQANYYKNLFDTKTKFIRPKLPNGKFIDNFDPMKGWEGFQEGNAYQFTWYVPHDIKGLIKLIGKDLFNERLQTMFKSAKKTMFGGDPTNIHSFSGVDKLYNHGNQPCLHIPWLFNYSGKPWMTQKIIREICDDFYGTEPLHGYGIGQDEDQGQLGAWFVLASMGLFDVQGHSNSRPSFQFSSPIFNKITIRLENKYYSGNKIVIETKREGKKNNYIQSATWNGKKINNSWIYRDEIMKGGKLLFTLGDDPNKKWGANTPPPSMSDIIEK